MEWATGRGEDTLAQQDNESGPREDARPVVRF